MACVERENCNFHFKFSDSNAVEGNVCHETQREREEEETKKR
jgi:hypothetical protein